MFLTSILTRAALVGAVVLSLSLGACSDDQGTTNPPGGGGDQITTAKVGSKYIYDFKILDKNGAVDPSAFSLKNDDTSATIIFTGVSRDTVPSVSVSVDREDSTFFNFASDGSLLFRRNWSPYYDHVEYGAWIPFPGTVGASRTDTVLKKNNFLVLTIKATSKREADTTITVGSEALDCRKYSTHLAIHYQGGAAYNDGHADMVLYVSKKLGYVVKEWYLRGGQNESGNEYEGGHVKMLKSYTLQ